ncbi:helix-turn-helix domain-containing protein [Gordonia sp. TBRC 11910]|uniref:Helix-turn-helix domain-containing protein n=1 Tax=Gordonia asplenii TaxID=2725283 RepID=A0A848KLR7_9ACTN|nr:helix-turn-helix domain-containing protein [Gordonia asplenii]NMO00034.1 helix-turn-helix domain-containing protein [Gordonia asplenii]
MRFVWDTAQHPVTDQMAYWTDVVCQAFTPLVPERRSDHLANSAQQTGLYGYVRSERLAATNTAEIASCTQELSHGRREVKCAPSEEVFVNLQLEGTCLGEQDGAQCVVPAGGFAVFDTTRPYKLEFIESSEGHPWRVLSFRIPRDQLMPLVRLDAQITARTVSGGSGVGAVAATMMQTLWKAHGSLDEVSRLALDHACSQVVASSLGSGVIDSENPDRAAIDDALRTAVRHYILANISHGVVQAAAAARHVGVSVRKLHQLFNGVGTSFGAEVRELRLTHAARDLVDSDRSSSIADIAARWGFCDGSHLTRAFKQRYGCAPRDYRAQHIEQVAR